jgi:hypothetical protein
MKRQRPTVALLAAGLALGGTTSAQAAADPIEDLLDETIGAPVSGCETVQVVPGPLSGTPDGDVLYDLTVCAKMYFVRDPQAANSEQAGRQIAPYTGTASYSGPAANVGLVCGPPGGTPSTGAGITSAATTGLFQQGRHSLTCSASVITAGKSGSVTVTITWGASSYCFPGQCGL